MSDLISRKALGETMYKEVFLKDSNDQRWDSGCWIRYKMFENALASAPTIDAVPVVRCKDCRYFHRFTDWADCDFHEWYRAEPNENDYCSRGERRDSDV